MRLTISNIPKMTLAELRESEANAAEQAEKFHSLLGLSKDLSKSTEDERCYQGLIELGKLIRAEISSRKQLIDNLSDLTVLELRTLKNQYDEEVDYWHEELIKTEYDTHKYTKYLDEAEQTRNQIRAQIAKRMDFLDGLAKLTMSELALTEARYHQESEKLDQEYKTNHNLPLIAEKYRKKCRVSIEARDMLRAEIIRRRQKK